MTTGDSLLGRRAAFAVLGSFLITLVLAACAGGGGEPARGSGRRRKDDRPFWEREEQRD